jgi:pyruvate, water dikinase
MTTMVATRYGLWFDTLSIADIPLVGGKNANLGEMISHLKSEVIRVPDGFAITVQAYQDYLEHNHIAEYLQESLLAYQAGSQSLSDTGRQIRRLFLEGTFPTALEEEIRMMYEELGRRYHRTDMDVAVRSSATAEDLPEASFAGQHESFLNVTGLPKVLEACRECYASLFTDRAIAYREENGFDHLKLYLSIGIQKMVRSDKAGSGVMFSIDTDSGFPRVVLINAAWGLGENIVLGRVTPDEYLVFKPLLDRTDLIPIVKKALGAKEKKLVYAGEGPGRTHDMDTTATEKSTFVLSDAEIMELARWARIIEMHYGKPMDMEWAKDGETGELYLVQARPETVQSRKPEGLSRIYHLEEEAKPILTGLSIGNQVATGKISRICGVEEMDQFEEGNILVTPMTDPDWVPIIKKAAGIITDRGGRTCHAAIVAREFGIPAVVGTGNATQNLNPGQEITLSCCEGEQGFIYPGSLKFSVTEQIIESVPETRTKIMMNIASPATAFNWWRLPLDGIGLARMEFIINNQIKVHPMALVRFNQLEDQHAKAQIADLTQGYIDKTEYFVENLARGIAQIAASQYPNPVIVRTSDFKTNEYANLMGGSAFEPKEENPMLGFRGASRYYSEQYREGFALECKALARVRDEMGFTNVIVMIPFCRTLEEADRVLAEMVQHGLKRHENGLQVYVMCEVPSNVILAEGFAKRFDGFSIGSNDLTQLTLGVDRDSALLSYIFDERNAAVKDMIQFVIKAAHKAGIKVGICGQAPSDYPEFADFLIDQGIDSISLNPDSVIPVKFRVAEREKEI